MSIATTNTSLLGHAFLANPDLVARYQKGLPLNAPDMGTLFTPGAKGYTDYALAAAGG